jgi:hypothetical protein
MGDTEPSSADSVRVIRRYLTKYGVPRVTLCVNRAWRGSPYCVWRGTVEQSRDDDSLECLCLADIPRLTWDGMSVALPRGTRPTRPQFLDVPNMYTACLDAAGHLDMAQAIVRALQEDERWSPPRRTWMAAVVNVRVCIAIEA